MDTDSHIDAGGAESPRSVAMTSVHRERGDAPRLTSAPLGPRWQITTVDKPAPPSSTGRTAQPDRARRPAGAPGQLADRVLVQTSAGPQLAAVLPYIQAATSGLVLSRGRMKNRNNLRRLIEDLPNQGLDAPVVFDPEGYLRHTASTAAPFELVRHGMFAETLDENLSGQRELGAHVALTPTGFIGLDGVDALEAAAAQANRLDRDDFMFTAPLDAAIFDDSALTARTWSILNNLHVPVALVLASQLDPLDKNARSRITALREFASGPADVAGFRTDFNAFDLLCHGGFTGAIGTGGSKRHAVNPNQRAMSTDPEDESPSVLFPSLASWWRGSRIVREHGRMHTPACFCRPCEGQRLGRFLSREDSADARAHAIAVWQQWSSDILALDTTAKRGAYWKTFCQGRIDEHHMLSQHLRRAKPLAARPAFTAWAKLPA